MKHISCLPVIDSVTGTIKTNYRIKLMEGQKETSWLRGDIDKITKEFRGDNNSGRKKQKREGSG